MTLGFSGNKVWPIYIGEGDGSRIDISKGSLMMYRGEDVPHWRPELKSDWQCQVFFHYVDADGEHADAPEFDGRETLGVPAAASLPVNQNKKKKYDSTHRPVMVNRPSRHGPLPIYNGVMIPSWDIELPGALTYCSTHEPQLAFTPEECDRIIAFADEDYAENGSIGTGDKGKVNKEIRNVDLYRIENSKDSQWVFDKIARIVSVANAEHFDFEIMGITHELQLLHYKSGEEPGHYNWHMDVGPGVSATRKISLSIQLTAPTDYTGGELLVNSNGENVFPTTERGSVNLFPSYCMHRVTPMETGERWALVIWVHGSKRFR